MERALIAGRSNLCSATRRPKFKSHHWLKKLCYLALGSRKSGEVNSDKLKKSKLAILFQLSMWVKNVFFSEHFNYLQLPRTKSHFKKVCRFDYLCCFCSPVFASKIVIFSLNQPYFLAVLGNKKLRFSTFYSILFYPLSTPKNICFMLNT